jgi:thiamine biosynthesis lipoprotein
MPLVGKEGSCGVIGIKDPRRKGLLGYIEAEDLAVISSGDYERVFVKGGKL